MTGLRGQIPSGFPELDEISRGGFPSGSLLLLSGELGAGAPEFAYTSASMITLASHDPEVFGIQYGSSLPGSLDELPLPSETHFISLTRSKDDLISEIRTVLDEERLGALEESANFVDLSMSYYRNTPVPRSWVEEQPKSLGELGETSTDELMSALADTLDQVGPGNLVVLDSLTSLVRASQYHMDWKDLLMLLTGMQEISNKWNGLIYCLLDRDALEPLKHDQIAAAVDGIINFDLEEEKSWKPKSTMFIRFIRGLTGKLTKENTKFETEITDEGFEVTGMERIR